MPNQAGVNIKSTPDLSGISKDLHPEFDVPLKRHEPFYRDHRDFLNSSFEINERKYLLHFAPDETGKRAMGIYNESKGEWELWPCLIGQSSDNTLTFFM